MARADPATRPAAQSKAEALPKPKPIPVPALPSGRIVDPAGETGLLAKSILALGAGPLGSPRHVLENLVLPQVLAKSSHLFALVPSNKKYIDYEYRLEGEDVALRLILRDGTWERPRGNSPQRLGREIVEGIELIGMGGMKSPAPAQAKMQAVHARSMVTPTAHGATTGRTLSPLVGVAAAAAMQVWGNYYYFQQGDGLKSPWYLARYDGRAPFHYTDLEVQEVSSALEAVTTAIVKGQSAEDFMRKEFASKRKEREGTVFFDFGAATIIVNGKSLSVACIAPIAFPKLMKNLGLGLIATSFANDYGMMASPTEGTHFILRSNRYLMPGGSDLRYSQMGEAVDARFKVFYLKLKKK